ncbi:MAG: Maf family protein [candidate division Zixibacteria bacterium]|nr:Maf family protein [candidate division Zixibacteria bacterium]
MIFRPRINLAGLIGKRKLTLASRSPRRMKLLKEANVSFEVTTPKINEKNVSKNPRQHVLRLSKMKAKSVLSEVESGLVLGADTIVVLDGEILGKPKNRKEAKRMLGKLSNREHKVYTGLTLIDKDKKKTISNCECTKVRFNSLSSEDIDNYISTGEPVDKAGAYGIQGKGSRLVGEIKGSLDNVIGLPMDKLEEMLIHILR